MSKEIIVFGDIEIEKGEFHNHKNLILLEHVDTDNMHVSSIASSIEKHCK